MGYYTDYKLEVKFVCPDCGQISACNKNVERKISKSSYETRSSMSEDSLNAKWYGHESDVTSLSMRFPDVLFILSGEGERKEDIWKKYFLNGKIQRAPAKVEIVMPEFDITKLA